MSTDKAESTAFNHAAPADERTDALAGLQKSHAPTSLGDLILPRSDMQEVISYISGEWQDAQLGKALQHNVVPFPSKFAREKKRGMQSVHLDHLQITAMGDYWEKPTTFGFDAMRQMAAQTPVLNAVILTRVRQVLRFCRVNESGEGPGFTVAHTDKGHELSDQEIESIRLLNRFITNCGWEFNPRARRRLRRDSFPQLMSKLVRDSLVLDSAPIETEMARDLTLGIDGMYAVDGATIRLCTEDGYQGDDEVFALQVVQGRISAAYNFDELIYEPRNPQSDVLVSGYGLAETELMIRVVTGFLNAMTYNIKGFDSNAIPRGVLHLSGSYDDKEIAAFKRYWNAMVKGVNNAWALPVMVSKDQESKAGFENFGIEFNEMYFSKWMTFLTSIICAIYGMSPAEINFDSFTAGNTSALAGSDTDEKLAASRDSGLWPLLTYFEGLISDYVISDFSEKYVFRWTGIDQEDSEKREERARLVMTVNEMRAQERLPPLEGDFGDAPINPALTGVWMQLNQQNQPQDFGQPPGQSGGNPPDNGDGEQEDEGDESDYMAAEDGQQGAQTAQAIEQDDSPDSEQKFGKSWVLAKGGKPGAEGLVPKVVVHSDGRRVTHWVRLPESPPGSTNNHRAPEIVNEAGKLLAPNGKPSKLTEPQWHQVRSPKFKKWFGDWEALSDLQVSGSKAVDENGEPMVVYHGGADLKQIESKGRFGQAIFVKEGGASNYGSAEHPLFLRGNVLELDALSVHLNDEGGRDVLQAAVGGELDDDVADALAESLTDGSHYPDDEAVWEAIGAIDEADAQLEIQKLRAKIARSLGYTAVRTPDEFDGESLMVVVPNAIKSAIGNNGNFDASEDDITKAERFGPFAKAIGMPPVIRLTLPGVDDEASQ